MGTIDLAVLTIDLESAFCKEPTLQETCATSKTSPKLENAYHYDHGTLSRVIPKESPKLAIKIQGMHDICQNHPSNNSLSTLGSNAKHIMANGFIVIQDNCLILVCP